MCNKCNGLVILTRILLQLVAILIGSFSANMYTIACLQNDFFVLFILCRAAENHINYKYMYQYLIIPMYQQSLSLHL